MNSAPSQPEPWTRRRTQLALGSVALSALPLCAMIAEWAAATLTLGHIPRPMLDDPKSISLLSDVLHALTGLSLAALPVLTLGILPLWVSPKGRTRTMVFVGFACLPLPLTAITLWFVSPFDFAGWWFD